MNIHLNSLRSMLIKYYYLLFSKNNVVFIWIPKTGGTSIFKVLEHYGARKYLNINSVKENFNNDGIVTFGHICYSDLYKNGYISNEFHQKAYKFAFVRNPYSRMVSLYSYFIKMGRISSTTSFYEFCQKAVNPEKIGLYNYKGYSQCNPQISWFRNINLDFIGRFEKISSESKKLLSNLGMYKQHTLPHKNKSNHKHFFSYYDNNSLELINQFYHKDFKTLNYTMYDSIKDIP